MTSLTAQNIQTYLQQFDFKNLFIQELEWNILKEKPFTVLIKDELYILRPLAEKQGFKVYVCDPDAQGQTPDDNCMRHIERVVTKYGGYEHIIIYIDAAKTQQAWQWVKREQGKSAIPHTNKLHKGQSGALLAQKLLNTEFSVLEELPLTNVTSRVRSAFDVERVTKRFYDRFQKEHARFHSFIQGIQCQDDREWYTSIMLNRLMFIYFIQRQGFLDSSSDDKLDGKRDYLRQRLEMTRAQQGPDTFHTFYRYFLLKLFHDGLSKRQRTPELERLLGRVPYLNGGLFDVHQLEQENPAIEIADQAFEQIFDFFDDYDWHLDDRPNKSGNEINLDVLGYIFEKYINQKQMGAYYTKEDITEYISKNTILPYLLEATRHHCEIAFRPNGPVWSLLRDNPDEYIYEAMAKGTELPLPPEIASGLNDINQRGEWNKPAPEDYALPSEIWREVIVRRTHHEDVRGKLLAGNITDINDLITYNLDIRKFTRDLIEYCEGTDLLRAFYEQITKVTVLDPTCGSGAFLFAALNILEPLYQACLERMRLKVEEREHLNSTLPVQQRCVPRDIEQFQKILHEVSKHHNRAYFILKSIIINNLYGVDIMEEATEICKLRLFLKLVSLVSTYNEIEPLPDIDFNICAGNTLVGFTTLEEVRAIVNKDIRSALRSVDALEEIEQEAQEIERGFKAFRDLQTRLNLVHWDISDAKQQLLAQLATRNDKLDRYLAAEYGIDENNIQKHSDYQQQFSHWQHSHQPFHWYAQFYEIMHHGGFDVIIGNPPYVEYSKVRNTYSVRGYETESCGNLYAAVLERSLMLCRSGQSYLGLIIPLSICGGERFDQLRTTITQHTHTLWLANFEIFPSRLFDDAFQRLSILLAKHKKIEAALSSATSIAYVTRIQRWYASERPHLISLISYTHAKRIAKPNVFPKLASPPQEHILEKLLHRARGSCIAQALVSHHTEYFVYYQEATNYWMKATCRIPFYRKNGVVMEPAHGRFLFLHNSTIAHIIMALMNSSLFYLWFATYSDGFHLSHALVKEFPADSTFYETQQIVHLAIQLEQNIQQHARMSTRNTKPTQKEGKASDSIEIEEYHMVYTKPLLDQIDRALASYYGFTDEELDFIINYDIKYRMGRDSGDEGRDQLLFF